MLKLVHQGQLVNLKLSRISRISENVENGENENSILSQFNGPTSIHNYSIPLNDTPSAGLGLQLKGPTKYDSENIGRSGLFIEKILNGGAASKVR